MRRDEAGIAVIRAGASGDDAAAVDRVVLDADERHRRRMVLTGERGTTFLLDLPQRRRRCATATGSCSTTAPWCASSASRSR